MATYNIRVEQTKYTDYPCYSFYDIDASMGRTQAERMARERFCADFGFDFVDTKSYVMYNEARQKEDLQYLREHGLPDEIPS